MCETQELVTQHFDATAQEFDSIYTGEGKGRVGRALDHLLRRDMYNRFRLTLEACGDPKGQTILDVGCGSGRFMLPLAERGASVVGLDPAPNMIDLARKLAEQRGALDRCEFVVNDLAHFQPDRTYDVVLGIGLFDYLEDPLPTLRRMVELADRRVVVTFPRRWTYRAPIRKARLALRKCPVFFYDRRGVEALARDAGGEAEDLRVVGKIYFATIVPSTRSA